jgi:hypothetical protein
MSGWPAIAIIIAAQIAVAAFLIRLAARRWWDYLVIAVVTAALVRPAAHIIGDISEYLPHAIWSDDLEGKDQVILATVASAILLPLIASALAVCVVKKLWDASHIAHKGEVG